MVSSTLNSVTKNKKGKNLKKCTSLNSSLALLLFLFFYMKIDLSVLKNSVIRWILIIFALFRFSYLFGRFFGA